MLTEKAGIDAFLKQGGGDIDTIRIFGVLVYWLVILAALMVAFNSLDLAYVTDLVGTHRAVRSRSVMIALVILVFGAYFARFVRRALTATCRNIGTGEARAARPAGMYAIMVFVILIALDQMGLGDIIRQTFLILVGGARARARARLRHRRPALGGRADRASGRSRAASPSRRRGRNQCSRRGGLERRARAREAMAEPKIVAMVLAGGEGTRLLPLTAERSKPAVPFGGSYRIVDFVLSNLVNSGIHAIYMLVQYKSQSLIEHVRNGWRSRRVMPEHFITVVPPQMRDGPEWFQGTADAVYQNMQPDRDQNAPTSSPSSAPTTSTAWTCAQMVDFTSATRRRRHGRHVARAARESARRSASSTTDADGRVTGVPREAARRRRRCRAGPAMRLASMGNYIFSRRACCSTELRKAHERGDKRLRPARAAAHGGDARVYAYDFSTNDIPGAAPYEEQAYWRDVGTIERLLRRATWTRSARSRASISSTALADPLQPLPRADRASGRPASRTASIAAGTFVRDATIRNSLIRPRGRASRTTSTIEDSIIMDYCVIRRGARIRRVIVDRYNTIEAGRRWDSTRSRPHEVSRHRRGHRRRRQGPSDRHAPLL